MWQQAGTDQGSLPGAGRSENKCHGVTMGGLGHDQVAQLGGGLHAAEENGGVIFLECFEAAEWRAAFPGGRRRGGEGDDRGNGAVAALADRLNIAWVGGGISKRTAQLGDGLVDRVVA